MNITFKEIIGETGNTLSGILKNNGIEIGECRLYTDSTKLKWTICAWYIHDISYREKGYGKRLLKATLRKALEKYKTPNSINYIWDGSNEYVMKWLNKTFEAKCTCPVSVQKNMTADDWSAHIYELNRNKTMEFINNSGKGNNG